MRIHPVLLFAISVLCFSNMAQVARADQVGAAEVQPTQEGSAASFDKRLPPVIPGEEISHEGQKMNVWSTAGRGGAQVLQAEAPPVNGDTLNLPKDISVIIDQRHLAAGRRTKQATPAK